MEAALGVISLILYCAAIIGLSAGVTWLVIKISPSRDKPKDEPEADAA
jgi:hypothetical protein